MNEEDIIEEIKEWLNHETNFENLPEYDARNLYITVKGLLDLYNKEKETSQFIQSQLDKANAKLIEYDKNLGKLQNETIWKEKIREKIEYYYQIDDYVGARILENLLKE